MLEVMLQRGAASKLPCQSEREVQGTKYCTRQGLLTPLKCDLALCNWEVINILKQINWIRNTVLQLSLTVEFNLVPLLSRTVPLRLSLALACICSIPNVKSWQLLLLRCVWNDRQDSEWIYQKKKKKSEHFEGITTDSKKGISNSELWVISRRSAWQLIPHFPIFLFHRTAEHSIMNHGRVEWEGYISIFRWINGGVEWNEGGGGVI